MNPAEAIELLDRIASDRGGDPEGAHSAADDVLLRALGPEVAAAYQRVVDACAWWAHS